MLGDLLRTNARAAGMVLDDSPHIAANCPRRAGKTYAAVLAALITGEAKPGSITLIISLNLKQLRRLYWAGGPSGLFTVARKYGLNLQFNNTYLKWEHENGSMGYLLGADDEEQLEVIRGLEADLYIIDECKSFQPVVLTSLIDDIIDPQRASRQGRIMMIGTPGHIFAGPFWKATCPAAKDKTGKPYHVDYGSTDPWNRTPKDDLLWSHHHWTLADNTAKPHQWTEALKKKRQMGWSDDDPTWCREYLGLWTTSGEGLVFRYHEAKGLGRATWVPERTKQNPAGLPEEGAPWRLIAGLDFGYEAPTAFVVCAYSARLRQLRHVHDESHQHMLVPDVAEMIQAAVSTYGPIEKIYADVGNLGKMVVETLVREYGFPLERADKREKFDHIELLNAAFSRGEVLILENTILEHQLLTNAWDLRSVTEGDDEEDAKTRLARLGKLREDDAIPNDSTDAMLYCFRGSLHHFAWKIQTTEAPAHGTPEWIKLWEKAQLAKARAEFAKELKPGTPTYSLPRAPSFVQRALKHRWSLPTISRRS